MVPSRTDIIIHSRRISQSETGARTNSDVVNPPSAAWRRSKCHIDFRLLRYIPTMPCIQMRPNYFVVVLLPSQQLPGRRLVQL